MNRISKLLLCAAFLVFAVGCSDDSDDDAGNSTDTTEAADSGAQDDSDGGQSDDDFDLSDTDLGIRAAGLEAGLNATAEVVNETTVRLTIDSGTVEIDYIGACAVAGSILEDDETAILVYPDGEHTC